MQNHFTGCLLGVAIGDALGAPVEFLNAEEIKQRHGRVTEYLGGGWLNLKPGEYTDDTALMLCIARSIVDRKGFDAEDISKRFLKWLTGNPKDIGNITLTALQELKKGAPWQVAGKLAHEKLGGMSAGNGSIMRCAPIGLLHFRDEKNLIRDSLDSSLITHWDPRACCGTVALDMAIASLVHGEKDGLLINLGEKIEEPDTRKAVLDVANLKKSDLIPSGFVLDTLKCALWCFLNTNSLESAIVEAVNLGGDADTVGAVCGSLAGAYYGKEAIPQRWLEPLSGRDEIEKLALEIYKLAQKDVL